MHQMLLNPFSCMTHLVHEMPQNHALCIGYKSLNIQIRHHPPICAPVVSVHVTLGCAKCSIKFCRNIPYTDIHISQFYVPKLHMVHVARRSEGLQISLDPLWIVHRNLNTLVFLFFISITQTVATARITPGSLAQYHNTSAAGPLRQVVTEIVGKRIFLLHSINVSRVTPQARYQKL